MLLSMEGMDRMFWSRSVRECWYLGHCRSRWWIESIAGQLSQSGGIDRSR